MKNPKYYIRVSLIERTGEVSVTTISILEDLFHDYRFFKKQGAELDRLSATPEENLKSKRFYRAALLALVFYFEGVLNCWLENHLTKSEWKKAEKTPLCDKIERINSFLESSVKHSKPNIQQVKKIRDKLAHFKPGSDLELYRIITRELLQEAEKEMDEWLTNIESHLQVKRHPDTKLLASNNSQAFKKIFGKADSESNSADV